MLSLPVQNHVDAAQHDLEMGGWVDSWPPARTLERALLMMACRQLNDSLCALSAHTAVQKTFSEA